MKSQDTRKTAAGLTGFVAGPVILGAMGVAAPVAIVASPFLMVAGLIAAVNATDSSK